MASNAPAQQPVKRHSLSDRFQKMDANHDGILSQAEFVAAHPKIGAVAAKELYRSLAVLGGTTTQSKTTGMTFEQFKKAHKLWKASHPKSN
jgi:Ca2+-binding EF-hand superfamily protein